MNSTRLLERPYMGQPSQESLTAQAFPGIPVQRIDTAVESPRLTFRELLHQQAQALSNGDIGVGNFAKFWAAAGPLSYCEYDVHETYLGPDKKPLLGIDERAADLLWRMRDPTAWMVNQEDADRLQVVRQVFAGRSDELDVLAEYAAGVPAAREWLGRKLGITNPYAFSLDDLAQKAAMRLELSEAIAAGSFTELFQAAAPPRRRAIAVVPIRHIVSVPVHPEALANGGTPRPVPGYEDETISIPRFVPQRRTSGLRLDGFELGDPGPRFIRSHREHTKRPGRARRVLAAAMLVATGLFVHSMATPGEEPRPAILNVDQPPPILDMPIVTPPSVPEQPPADHIMSIGGEYDPQARTGAIWFNVEDYAAQLGYSSLTLLQTHLLTDRSIQYMNTRVSGGMSWDKARHLPSNAQLPYPPTEVMRAWIAEVLAQTS